MRFWIVQVYLSEVRKTRIDMTDRQSQRRTWGGRLAALMWHYCVGDVQQ